MLRAVLVGACLLRASIAWSSPSPEDLARIRSANIALYGSLQSFVCDERIERFRSPIGGDDVKHIDTVTTRVSFENGAEHYSNIRQDGRARSNLRSIGGAWSEGEFGTLIRQTQELIASSTAVSSADAGWQGEPAVVISFDVPAEDSPWNLLLDSGVHYQVAFRSDIYVSKHSGQIVRIARESKDLPQSLGISALRWSVNLKTATVHDAVYTVPDSAEYSVEYSKHPRREWNRISFLNFRRYGSEATVTFE